MAITVIRPVLSANLLALGKAYVYVGDPQQTGGGGMALLGTTEGDIVINTPHDFNILTAPEVTGQVPHQATTTPGQVTVTIPVINGDPTVWAKLSPTGLDHDGFSDEQDVVTTSLLVIPKSEVPATVGLAYNGTAWTPAAPSKNTFWLWRAYLTYAADTRSHGNGGKSIINVTATGMYDATKAEGFRVYQRGDPTLVGNGNMTTLLI